MSHVGRSVEQARREAHERIATKVPLAKLQRLAQELQRAAKQRESETRNGRGVHRRNGWLWALEARVQRRADGLTSAIDLAGAMYAGERLHQVRLALKKLRYAAELHADAGSVRASKDLVTLKNVQDLLGHLHDLESVIERTREAQSLLAAPASPDWRQLEALVRCLQDDCRLVHAGYIRQRTHLLSIANRISRSRSHGDVTLDRAAS